jgi:hypothetical protein
MPTLSFATSSSATLGMTGAVLRKSCNDLLESNDVSVCLSEKDVVLGAPLLRAIDKGLAKSRAGILLVTPALLTRLASEGIAEVPSQVPGES